MAVRSRLRIRLSVVSAALTVLGAVLIPITLSGGRTMMSTPKSPLWRRKLRVIASALLLTVAGLVALPAVAAAADFTQSVTAVSSTQAQFSFTPTTPAALVDVHYTGAPGLGQQNFRMANNGGTWQQTVGGLTTGTVLDYWFTYEKGGPLFDTQHFSYTHGGGGGGGNTAATPTFNPPGGTYTAAQTVSIATATAGATIRYTTDGSTPTASSTVYGGPISVPSSRTINAIAIRSGMTNSGVGSATYTIGTGGGGGGPGTFPLILQNNTGGRWANSQIFVMVLGMAVEGQWSYLKPNGTLAHISHLDAGAPGHLTKNGVNYANMAFTLAQASTVALPPRILGGRIYISLGTPMYIPISPDDAGWGGPDLHNPADPNADVYFDWYEYTFGNGTINYGGNTTQVDMFGFPMTARLQQTAIGYDQKVGITLTRDQVLSRYSSTVGAAFRPLAGTFRIIAPRSSATFAPGGSQANYLQGYLDQVWNQYTASQFTLTRLNQTFTGRVANGVLQFTKDGAGPFFLNKPTTKDVVECSGALASAGMSTTALELGAEFCAAFNRGVAQNTANWYNASAYYANTVKNDYAQFFHTIGIANRAYGFAYDDINDQSSVRILPNANPPTSLTLAIGW